MKKKYLFYIGLPVLGLALLGVGVASAHGWFLGTSNLSPDEIASQQQTMFQNEAQILGISVDEVKNAWAAGKTVQQIMQEKGISQDQVQQNIKNLQTQQMKSYLQTLVDKGVITQAQADQRLQTMQNMLQNKQGKMGMRGMGMGWFGGLHF